MRMLNDINNVLSVEEVVWLDATPVWEPDKEFDADNPDYFIVSVRYTFMDEDENIGEYALDGTPETYQKAVENFNSICLKAASAGCFRLTDFENFRLI